MLPRYFMLTLYGTLLTFGGTFIHFYFAPAPLPPMVQFCDITSCVICVVITILTYRGWPPDLARPLSPLMRGIAFVVMLLSGGVWVWLIVLTVMAPDSMLLTLWIERSFALFLCAAAYYAWTQKPRYLR